MKRSYPSLIEFAILSYCVYQASDLSYNWGAISFLRLGWLCFFLWMLPVPLYWLYPPSQGNNQARSTLFLSLALTLALMGSLGSLHALSHLGLAFAVVALTPPSWWWPLWLAAALSWLPAIGYFARYLPSIYVIISRVILAGSGLAIGLLATRTQLKRNL